MAHRSMMLQHNTAQQMLDEAFAFCIDKEFALEVKTIMLFMFSTASVC